MTSPVDPVIDLFTESELHELLRCERCNSHLYPDGEHEQPCRIGNCVEMVCNGCGHVSGGWGPVGCPCSGMTQLPRKPSLKRRGWRKRNA